MKQPKTSYIYLRVTDDTRVKFYDKASCFGPPADVLREIVSAFIEDRLIINAPATSNWKELYNVPRSPD